MLFLQLLFGSQMWILGGFGEAFTPILSIGKRIRLRQKYDTFMESNIQEEKPQSQQLSMGRKIWRFLWIGGLSLVLLSVLLVVRYKFVNPMVTPLMCTRLVQQVVNPDRPVRLRHQYVSIDKISPYLVNAVVASEDGNFMRHHGFEISMMKSAYRENQLGRRVRGGSTISMQTAKNAFLPHQRSIIRKGLEAYFTQLIEWTWGKKRIMECYLNIIEFGDGIYGAEAASQYYFGHSAATLSPNEAAQLAVTLPSPLKRNPASKTPFFRSQTSVVQARAARYGRVNLDRPHDRKVSSKEETIFDFIKWYIEQEKGGGKKNSKSTGSASKSSHKVHATTPKQAHNEPATNAQPIEEPLAEPSPVENEEVSGE